MNAFEDYIFQSFASQIASWNADLLRDIYALGFLVYFEDQDLRYGTVGLVYNTLQDYQRVLATAKVSSHEADTETKWHFECWHQQELWITGQLLLIAKSSNPYADPVGASLRQIWLEGGNLWYTDQEEEADFDTALEMGDLASSSFYGVCVCVARRLHAEGFTKIGNKPAIPIVFHNGYYDNDAADYTNQANPPGLAEEFEQYINVVRPSARH